jgi:pilus assembly protein CpaB
MHMPLRSIVILALGLVIALGTAFSLQNRVQKDGKAGGEMVRVLVATSDIAAGSFVRAESQLAFVEWPGSNITKAMVTSANSKPLEYNGAVARRAIGKGEPILRHLLVKSNEGGFMSAVLEPGKRAVSIPVDSTTGNAGFIFPGDRVDLILTHAVTKHSVKSRASETFVENVRILAVDQMLDNPENKAVLAKTVTLEVSPKQAEQINLAKDLGKISLSLRSLATEQPALAEASEKLEQAKTAMESLDDVLGQTAAQATAAAETEANGNVTRDTEISKIINPLEASGSQVVLIRGSERTLVEFGSGNENGGNNEE